MWKEPLIRFTRYHRMKLDYLSEQSASLPKVYYRNSLLQNFNGFGGIRSRHVGGFGYFIISFSSI